jgi:hypothetical protein
MRLWSAVPVLALVAASALNATCRTSKETSHRFDHDELDAYASSALPREGGSSPDGSTDAPKVPVTPPGPPPFRVESWLAEHGIKESELASLSRSKVATHGDEGETDTSCFQSFTLEMSPPIDFLACFRAHMLPSPGTHQVGPWFQAVTHTVLLAADHGHLRTVLDVPSQAHDDEELSPPDGMVSLEVSASSGSVLLSDTYESKGSPCDSLRAEAVKSHVAITRTRSALASPGVGIYASICASAGEYVWRGDRLVHLPRP